MNTDAEQNPLTIEKQQESVAKELAEEIQKNLGIIVPLEQLKRFEWLKYKRFQRFCSLINGTDFSPSWKSGFRTTEVSTEPNAHWVSMYNSLDLVFKRKIVLGVAQSGKPTGTFTDGEVIMVVKLEDGTRKRIRIVTTYNIVERTTTSVFSELPIEV